jgi:hypothetical protein
VRAGPTLPRLVPWVGVLPEPSQGSWRRAPGPDQMRTGARSLLLRQAQAWQGQFADSPLPCPFREAADFAQDQRGAPIGLQGWHWSVSHSSGWCAALLAPTAALGLDVELAARRLSPTVIARLRPLLRPGAEPTEPQDWLDLWVRLEAGLKLSGEGLGLLAKIAADAPDARGRQRLHWPGGTALTRAVRVGPLVIAAAALDDFELEPWSAPVAWLLPPPPVLDSESRAPLRQSRPPSP